MIDLSQLKKNDIIYAINSGSHPIVINLFIDTVICDEKIFSKTYNIKVLLPDGSYKFIEFNKTLKSDNLIENKAYIKTLNNSIINLGDDSKTYIIGFDRDIVINNYINSIKKHIELVEETIKRGKTNLIELNEKLNFIQKQIFDENKQ